MSRCKFCAERNSSPNSVCDWCKKNQDILAYRDIQKPYESALVIYNNLKNVFNDHRKAIADLLEIVLIIQYSIEKDNKNGDQYILLSNSFLLISEIFTMDGNDRQDYAHLCAEGIAWYFLYNKLRVKNRESADIIINKVIPSFTSKKEFELYLYTKQWEPETIGVNVNNFIQISTTLLNLDKLELSDNSVEYLFNHETLETLAMIGGLVDSYSTLYKRDILRFPKCIDENYSWELFGTFSGLSKYKVQNTWINKTRELLTEKLPGDIPVPLAQEEIESIKLGLRFGKSCTNLIYPDGEFKFVHEYLLKEGYKIHNDYPDYIVQICNILKINQI
jgi:hypothetical protein